MNARRPSGALLASAPKRGPSRRAPKSEAQSPAAAPKSRPRASTAAPSARKRHPDQPPSNPPPTPGEPSVDVVVDFRRHERRPLVAGAQPGTCLMGATVFPVKGAPLAPLTHPGEVATKIGGTWYITAPPPTLRKRRK